MPVGATHERTWVGGCQRLAKLRTGSGSEAPRRRSSRRRRDGGARPFDEGSSDRLQGTDHVRRGR